MYLYNYIVYVCIFWVMWVVIFGESDWVNIWWERIGDGIICCFVFDFICFFGIVFWIDFVVLIGDRDGILVIGDGVRWGFIEVMVVYNVGEGIICVVI